MAAFFQTTTMIISIPSVVILTALFISLWGGSIRFTTPMLFALAFLPMFGIGGLTGLPLGLTAADIHLHDTYYVIGHFHYVVAPGTIFALFAGIYYWFPKATGRKMNETLGKLHFWPSLIFMNGDLHADVHRRAWRASRAGSTTAAPPTTSRRTCCTGTSSCSCSALGARARADPVHHQLLLEHQARREGGRQPVARDDARVGGAVAAAARQLRHAARRRTAGPTTTACPAQPRDFTPQCEAAEALSEHGDSLHRRRAARHRAQQRQDRHLAVPRLRGHAVRRALRDLHHAARRAPTEWPRGATRS